MPADLGLGQRFLLLLSHTVVRGKQRLLMVGLFRGLEKSSYHQESLRKTQGLTAACPEIFVCHDGEKSPRLG